jgi:hypothetical protein
MADAARPALSRFWKQLAAALFLLFLALWVFGVARTFTLSEPDIDVLSSSFAHSMSSGPTFREVGSGSRTAHNLAQIGLTQAPLPQVLDQADVSQIRVYDKTAQVAAATTAFADDEDRIRKVVAGQQAVVFSEKATGVAPQRALALGISVHPERFDALLRAVSEVGRVESSNVEQQDRTAEFRRLYAQRQSLKKHQEAMLKLRGVGKLSVEEALKLEQKIFEVEKEVQSVGVQLGDFLGKEPSYNLYVTLQENRPGSWHDRSFTFGRRLGQGFLWALGWWAAAALGIGLAVGAYVSVKTLRSTVPGT